jgi:hypothetical protein
MVIPRSVIDYGKKPSELKTYYFPFPPVGQTYRKIPHPLDRNQPGKINIQLYRYWKNLW